MKKKSEKGICLNFTYPRKVLSFSQYKQFDSLTVLFFFQFVFLLLNTRVKLSNQSTSINVYCISTCFKIFKILFFQIIIWTPYGKLKQVYNDDEQQVPLKEGEKIMWRENNSESVELSY